MNYNGQMAYQMPQQPQYIYSGQGTQQRPAYQPTSNWNNSINRIRPVSSIEEVRASAIDFDGSIFYFPDLANKKIYTKFINLDGTASINMYELKEIPVNNINNNEVNTQNYITRQEFEDTINQLKFSLQQPPITQQQETRKETPLFNL